MRPHRPVVVAQRVEAGRRSRQGAQAEARRTAPANPAGRRPGRLLLGAQQPAAQQVAHVRGDRVDRLAVPVQRQRRVAAVLVGQPEPLPELLGELGRPAAPALGAGPAERRQQLGAGDGRRVAVGLHLGQRHRRVGQPAVGERDRVGRVLPALVGQAVPGPVDIAEKAVAVGAVVGQPRQGPLQVGQQLLDLGRGQAPPPAVVQQQDPQRGGVHRAVVGGRQPQRPAQLVALVVLGLGGPDLVQDLARLLGRVRVHPAALPAGQGAQRAAGQPGAQRQQHPGREQAVPAEQGQVPGRPGGQEVVVRRLRVGQLQRREVGDRPGEEAGQPWVALSTRRHRQPGRPGRRGHHRCSRGGRGVAQPDGDAAPGAEFDVPAEPGRRGADLGRSRRRRGADPGAVRAGPVQAVRGLVGGRFGGGQARLDVGHAGQVAAQLQAQPGPHRLPGRRAERDLLGRAGPGRDPAPFDGHGGIGSRVAEAAGHRHAPAGIGAGQLTARSGPVRRRRR